MMKMKISHIHGSANITMMYVHKMKYSFSLFLLQLWLLTSSPFNDWTGAR